MEKFSTEEDMGKLDMFQSRFREIDEFVKVVFVKISSRCMIAIYLDGIQRRMPNSRSSLGSGSSGTSGKNRTSQSDTENVAYNCTLSYSTC